MYTQVLMKLGYLAFVAFLAAWFNNPQFAILAIFVIFIKNRIVTFEHRITSDNVDIKKDYESFNKTL